MYDVERIRQAFTYFSNENEENLIYLDNASTMQLPMQVTEALVEHYRNSNGNPGRGLHDLSKKTQSQCDEVRKKTADFLQVHNPEDIIFTSGTTGAINMIARMLEASYLKVGDEILISEMEHHSNMLIWQKICQSNDCYLKFIPVLKNGDLDLESFYSLISEKTKLVSITQQSNVTGFKTPLQKIIPYIRSKCDAAILVDGAQGVLYGERQIEKMDCDFYCFSSHKLGGLTGSGALYMKRKWFKTLRPHFFGGGMDYESAISDSYSSDDPRKYEVGTINYAGIIAHGAAIAFHSTYKIIEKDRYCDALMNTLENGLKEIKGLTILGDAGESERKGVLSFTVEGISSYDIATYLNMMGFAVRSGHHCAKRYHQRMGVESSLRVSPGLYNRLLDIEKFIGAVNTSIARLDRS